MKTVSAVPFEAPPHHAVWKSLAAERANQFSDSQPNELLAQATASTRLEGALAELSQRKAKTRPFDSVRRYTTAADVRSSIGGLDSPEPMWYMSTHHQQPQQWQPPPQQPESQPRSVAATFRRVGVEDGVVVPHECTVPTEMSVYNSDATTAALRNGSRPKLAAAGLGPDEIAFSYCAIRARLLDATNKNQSASIVTDLNKAGLYDDATNQPTALGKIAIAVEALKQQIIAHVRGSTSSFGSVAATTKIRIDAFDANGDFTFSDSTYTTSDAASVTADRAYIMLYVLNFQQTDDNVPRNSPFWFSADAYVFQPMGVVVPSLYHVELCFSKLPLSGVVVVASPSAGGFAKIDVANDKKLIFASVPSVLTAKLKSASSLMTDVVDLSNDVDREAVVQVYVRTCRVDKTPASWGMACPNTAANSLVGSISADVLAKYDAPMLCCKDPWVLSSKTTNSGGPVYCCGTYDAASGQCSQIPVLPISLEKVRVKTSKVPCEKSVSDWLFGRS